MPTGEVELAVDELTIVSRSTPLPFQLDEENVDETLRLRYRWLDLRREKLQRNIRLRARMVGIIRRHMEEAGFLDIQTPDPLQVDTRGSARLRRPEPAAQGPLLRASAEPADPQAADDDRRLRSLLPDRDLLPRRGSPCRPRAGDHPARRRDELPRPRGALPADGADVRRDLARMPRRRDRDAVAAHDLRRGGSSIRLRQAGHAFRARARGRDRGDQGLGVRGLRRRGCGAVPARPADVSAAPRSSALEELAKERGAKGLAYLDPRRGRRGALPDREVPVRARARDPRTGAGGDAALRGRRVGGHVEGARAPAPPPRTGARPGATTTRSPSSG